MYVNLNDFAASNSILQKQIYFLFLVRFQLVFFGDSFDCKTHNWIFLGN
jgi:hypothetical protein